MKDLVLGAFDHYNYEQVQYWVNSIKMSGFEGDICLVVFNTDKETVIKLTEKGVIIIALGQDDEGNLVYSGGLPVHTERFFHFFNFLYNFESNYRYVIVTDVKDVIFQTNPSEWLEQNMVEKIIVGTEALTYENEAWGDQNLDQTFGAYFHNLYKTKEIFNVGVLAGEASSIRDLCRNIFHMSINRKIPIVDQAVFNMLIHGEPYLSTTQYAKLKDGWTAHLGTTSDPNKPELVKHLLEEQPIFQFYNSPNLDLLYSPNNRVRVATPHEKPFCVVHQYDRVPGISHVIKETYRG